MEKAVGPRALRRGNPRLRSETWGTQRCAGSTGLGCGLGFSGGSCAGAVRLLNLQDLFGQGERCYDATPDDGLDVLIPVGEARDQTHFEKDDCAGEAAGHPLAVELDLSLEDEDHGHGGGEYPDRGVGDRGDREGARGAQPLLEVLDVDAYGCAD